MVRCRGHVLHDFIRTLRTEVVRNAGKFWSRRVGHRDGLDTHSFIEAGIHSRERTGQHVAIVTRVVVAFFHCHQGQTTCIGRQGVQQQQLVTAIRFVARWNEQLRAGRIYH